MGLLARVPFILRGGGEVEGDGGSCCLIKGSRDAVEMEGREKVSKVRSYDAMRRKTGEEEREAEWAMEGRVRTDLTEVLLRDEPLVLSLPITF